MSPRSDDPVEPMGNLVAIAALCPTQITVGMAEVDKKRRRYRDLKDKREFLSRRIVPVLLGPDRRSYMIDRHHLTRALLDEGVAQVAVKVEGNPFFCRMSAAAFWTILTIADGATPTTSGENASSSIKRCRVVLPISATTHSAACLGRRGVAEVSLRT